jgi:plasmid stabilization system protein ParE
MPQPIEGKGQSEQQGLPHLRGQAATIYESASSLKSFPHKGRVGRVEGTRELPLPPLPFVVIYRIIKDIVKISNVVHGAQRWPPEE